MQLIISGKNFTVTPSMKTLMEEKLARITRFWSDIIRAHLEVSMNRHHRHGNTVVVYAWLEIPGNDIRASVRADNFSTALDVLLEKLKRQAVRMKERRRVQRSRRT